MLYPFRVCLRDSFISFSFFFLNFKAFWHFDSHDDMLFYIKQEKKEKKNPMYFHNVNT